MAKTLKSPGIYLNLYDLRRGNKIRKKKKGLWLLSRNVDVFITMVTDILKA